MQRLSAGLTGTDGPGGTGPGVGGGAGGGVGGTGLFTGGVGALGGKATSSTPQLKIKVAMTPDKIYFFIVSGGRAENLKGSGIERCGRQLRSWSLAGRRSRRDVSFPQPPRSRGGCDVWRIAKPSASLPTSVLVAPEQIEKQQHRQRNSENPQ